MNINGRRPNTKSFGIVKSGPFVPCPRCNGTGKIEAESVSIGDRFRAQRSKLGVVQACHGGSETCGYLCARVREEPVATWTWRGMEERE